MKRFFLLKRRSFKVKEKRDEDRNDCNKKISSSSSHSCVYTADYTFYCSNEYSGNFIGFVRTKVYNHCLKVDKFDDWLYDHGFYFTSDSEKSGVFDYAVKRGKVICKHCNVHDISKCNLNSVISDCTVRSMLLPHTNIWNSVRPICRKRFESTSTLSIAFQPRFRVIYGLCKISKNILIINLKHENKLNTIRLYTHSPKILLNQVVRDNTRLLTGFASSRLMLSNLHSNKICSRKTICKDTSFVKLIHFNNYVAGMNCRGDFFVVMDSYPFSHLFFYNFGRVLLQYQISSDFCLEWQEKENRFKMINKEGRFSCMNIRVRYKNQRYWGRYHRSCKGMTIKKYIQYQNKKLKMRTRRDIFNKIKSFLN